MLIAGEAGPGKSRLATEVRRRAQAGGPDLAVDAQGLVVDYPGIGRLISS